MYPVSARFLDALRHPLTITATATHRNLITGVTTVLPIEDGTVTEDVTSKLRRSLSLTLPGLQTLWDALDTPGGEITVTQTVQYVDRMTETIPMGVFIVDQEGLGYTPGGPITMTCPDRWLKVQRNKFGLSRSSVPSNAGWQEIKRLVEGAWPGSTYPFPGWSHLDTTATTKVGSLLWSNDREAAIGGITEANSLEVFFDRNGLAVLQPVPYLTPTSEPVWLVDASASGVMIGADRTRDRTNLRNVIIVSTSASDVIFNPVEVANRTAGDPLNITGPLGYVSEEWASPVLRNSAQAKAAGLTRLRKRLGAAQSVSITAAGNPALDGSDVIRAQYPQIDRNVGGVTELHILDTIAHPLMPAGTQTMQTRSTRPVTDGSP